MVQRQINWDQCLEYAELTDIGMRRANNQDAHAVALANDDETWRERGHLFIVADGMGAHAAGELASRLAADTVPHLYRKYRELSAPEALQRAVFETNAEVHRRGQANYDFYNMGTTCSVLTLLPQGAVIAHIGDSRVYRLRGDQLEQLTFDHSLVWEMRASGQLDEQFDLANLLPKNVITRSLGPNASVKVDIEGPFPIEVGDTFLLCSDGLTGKVTDEELGPILANLSPKEAARVLVDLANLRGGPDNITVIIVKVTRPEMTTRLAATEPIRLGGPHPADPIHPVLWAVMGACFLAAGGMLVLQSFVPALVATACGLVLLGMILRKTLNNPARQITVGARQRFGRAPYVKVSCAASADFVQQLAGTIQELRQAAKQQQWEINETKLDQLCRTAAAADQAGQHAKAVRDYAKAITFMMDQLRAQRARSASDSSVDIA